MLAQKYSFSAIPTIFKVKLAQIKQKYLYYLTLFNHTNCNQAPPCLATGPHRGAHPLSCYHRSPLCRQPLAAVPAAVMITCPISKKREGYLARISNNHCTFGA
jgi:hypothetical protein